LFEESRRFRRGLFHVRHWREQGLSSKQLRHRVAKGHVAPVLDKVYALSGAPRDFGFEVQAGVLRAGPVAAAFGSTAMAVRGLMKPGAPLHIGTPRNLNPIEGYVFHRVALPREHIEVVNGVAVTTNARTLLDACGSCHPQQAEMLFARTLRTGFDPAELEALLDREARQGRAGVVLARALLENLDPAISARLRSDLEQRFQDFLRRWHFPRPQVNVLIDTGRPFANEVDAYWPDHRRVVVEVNHHWSHWLPEDFDRNQDKVLDLEAAGYLVVPVTDRALENELALARKLWTILGLPGAPGVSA
jgi:hypothetical protein